ncbi:MAG: 2,3,4,5-tetrahydropyridine-2,6-dicarboxylate N-succinyltransferase, partial [Alphaproteobacteria bacterium]|nr:2,3,4,5-tetrahydropyridine-2,6-dicarboxylate N-succinyltransferase [Alphaproteobacteria bacterium]
MTANTKDLEQAIDAAWEGRDKLSPTTTGTVRDAVDAALAALDDGSLRVAEKTGAGWQVHQWLKKAVLLSFRLTDMGPVEGGPAGGHFYDKVPSKFEGWGDNRFREAGFRVVPPAAVRRGA